MKPFVLVGHSRPLSKVLYDWTNNILFSCCKGGIANAWNIDDGTLLKRYSTIVDGKKAEQALWNMDVTYDGDRLALCGAAGSFILDVTTGKQFLHIPTQGICRSIDWNKKPNHQNKLIVVRGHFMSLKSAIIVYEISGENCNEVQILLDIQDFTSSCVGAGWGCFDETIISWHEDGSLYSWNAETGEKLGSAKYFDHRICDVDFSSDRSFCLCASTDKTLKLIYTPKLEKVCEFKTDRSLNTCALSPLWRHPEPTKRRPHLLAAGGQSEEDVTTTKTHEGKVEPLLMHIVTGEILGQITGNFSPIPTIAMSRDGSGFAVGAVEGNIRLYKFDASYWTDQAYQG